MAVKHWTFSLALIASLAMSSKKALADEDLEVLEVDAQSYSTPLKLLPEAKYPVFADDYDFGGMKLAIERQLKRFSKKKLTGSIRMGTKTHKLSKAVESLVAFNSLIAEFERCASREVKARCYADFNQEIRKRFDVYAPDLRKSDPRYGDENFAFFTGYHTHGIEAKLQPQGEFKHAIYSNPHSSKLNKSRSQIDFGGALAGRGLEGAYSNFLFDIYLMHVAGSGKVTVNQPDGSKKEFYLHYDGTNKQRWEFIGPYMARKGYIQNGSIPAQRRFLRQNPNLQKEIFSVCPSYVFLKPSLEPPKGSDMVPVTDGRSIATDNSFYPFKGLLTYIESNRPVETGQYDLEEEKRDRIPFQPFSRFFLDQDTGGAIEGKARADIYWGSNDYAYFSAMHMENVGKIFYMMLK